MAKEVVKDKKEKKEVEQAELKVVPESSAYNRKETVPGINVGKKPKFGATSF